MTESHGASIDRAAEAVLLVSRWLAEPTDEPQDSASARLADALRDPQGVDFTFAFIDGVARPDDVFVAAKNLERLARSTPDFVPTHLRLALHAGGFAGQGVPWAVVPLAKRALRSLVGHLVLDASPGKLDSAIAELRADGTKLNLNLLGEAVLGEREAKARLQGTQDLLDRDDVDYVSIKVSSVVSGLVPWAFEDSVQRISETLSPLFERALPTADRAAKFINLDMEEYRDLDLTIAVFERILERPELLSLEAGIVLQAYLPDAYEAMHRLQMWSADRVGRGGAPIKVRLVKGANLALERVSAESRNWPLATYSEKVDTDANYKRILDEALTPERTENVRIGIAGHNLFDVAYAHLLASERSVVDRVEFEMLLGMSVGQAAAVRRTVGALRPYTPVVRSDQFDVAISYLARRLEENASEQNFLSTAATIASDPAAFDRERDRFLAAFDRIPALTQDTFRTQDRRDPLQLTPLGGPPLGGPSRGDPGFAPSPTSDPSTRGNREWARSILRRAEHTSIGVETAETHRVTTPEELSDRLWTTASAGEAWGVVGSSARAALLRRVALSIEANRDRLIEVMISETGKTFAEADPEVSEAADFARYYADRAEELDQVWGARFLPSRLTVVIAPWNFPVSIPAGSALAALATGSGVVVKPAPEARRSAAVLAQTFWEAGVSRELFSLIDLDGDSLGQNLVTDPLVDRVLLTGSYDTAAMFLRWKPDLVLGAETSGKNMIVVMPSADIDAAVSDIVASAFGHAGQKCSAASVVILVGSIGRSERFTTQLIDAVSSLRVGFPVQADVQMGPLILPPKDSLLQALTDKELGETWWVEPRRIEADGTDRLWTPGVKAGVLPGSAAHRQEFFGPVLAVMTVDNLDQAIELQNSTEYGLTAGLHSLEPDDVERWISGVQAGNLYLNKPITGAIAGRQPFGGWKRSSVGTVAKSGGPNALIPLGEWRDEPEALDDELSLSGLDTRVTELLSVATSGLDWQDFGIVRQAAFSDRTAWESVYRPREIADLGFERNILRHLPVPVVIRLSEGESLRDLVRVLAAGILVHSRLSVSTALKLPRPLRAWLKEQRIRVFVEEDGSWIERVRASGSSVERIRQIGGDRSATAAALRDPAQVRLDAGEVTRSGRIEIFAFVREQSLSLTNHRFGHSTDLTAAVFPGA